MVLPTGDYAFPEFATFSQADGLPVPSQIQTSQPVYAASTISSPRSGLVSPQNGEKRSADAMTGGNFLPAFEDASRLAAEEDKRRRNTAASARFRVKKKQREQALEKSAKEMSEKVSALENRINQLETENKWLKGLIMEKNESKDDIAALWKKYNQETAERKASERKDGVGTAKS
jgi:Basic region leucine zipper